MLGGCGGKAGEGHMVHVAEFALLMNSRLRTVGLKRYRPEQEARILPARRALRPCGRRRRNRWSWAFAEACLPAASAASDFMRERGHADHHGVQSVQGYSSL